MRREDFYEALDRYGGRLSAWPAELRTAAGDLIATDTEAAAELARAQRIDDVLARAVAPQPVDAAQIGHIVAGITGQGTRAPHETTLRPTGRLLTWVSAATMASLAAGFIAGAALPQDFGTDTYAGLMFGGATQEDSGSFL